MWRLLLLPCLALAAPRPVEFRDIIEMAEPALPRISPDGRLIVYSVRRSSLDKNYSESSLWVVSPGSAPRKLLDETTIGAAAWLPASDALMARLPRKGGKGFWRIPVDGGAPRLLFEHSETVISAWWSADATQLLFTSAASEDPEVAKRREREGLVYDETVHGIRNFTRNSWPAPQPQSLWLWRSGDSQAQRVALDLTGLGALRTARWSPEGQRVLLEYASRNPENVDTSHLAIMESPRGSAAPAIRKLVASTTANRGACWQPDGGRVYWAETGETGRYYAVRSRIRWIDPATGSGGVLPAGRPWFFLSGVECGGASLLAEYENQSRSTVYRIHAESGSAADAIPAAGHFSSCSFTPDQRWAACVRQSITEPPEVARVELATGRVEVLTRLNPEFANIVLSGATERKWRNRLGHESNGFLFLPAAWRPGGNPLPLIVIHYHFSNRFSAQAQWMTSYPVQHLVAAGFAVLLHNYPRELGWTPGDFAGAMRSQAENPLASLEAAVDSLVKEGIADPARKGIAGWSFGAWLAEMTITQSNLFQAASAGEGGLNNAGQYWVTGSRTMQEYLDAFFGGPPFGPAFENYRKLSPGLNADKVRTPLLREYGGDVGVQSLEFYMALRRLGKPVEQVIYPGAPHVFERPSHRLASMQRNLDWFRFWLQGVEDPSPAKSEQYRRWRALRDLKP